MFQNGNTPVGFSQQRRGMGFSYGDMSKDWVQEITMHPPKKDAVIVALLKMTRQLRKTPKAAGCTKQKKKGTRSYGSCSSRKRRGDPVGNQGRQQDGGGLDQWQGAKVGRRGSWECPKTTAGMMGRSRQFAKKGKRVGGAHFRERTEEADA